MLYAFISDCPLKACEDMVQLTKDIHGRSDEDGSPAAGHYTALLENTRRDGSGLGKEDLDGDEGDG